MCECCGYGEAIYLDPYAKYLLKLKDEFHLYFPEVDVTRNNLSFIKGLIFGQCCYSTTGLSREIIVTEKYLPARDLHKQSTLEKFWSNMLACYPDLLSYAVKFLLPFTSTYLCENGFLSLLNIESNQTKLLETVESDLHGTLSKTSLTWKALSAISASKSKEVNFQETVQNYGNYVLNDLSIFRSFKLVWSTGFDRVSYMDLLVGSQAQTS